MQQGGEWVAVAPLDEAATRAYLSLHNSRSSLSAASSKSVGNSTSLELVATANPVYHGKPGGGAGDEEAGRAGASPGTLSKKHKVTWLVGVL